MSMLSQHSVFCRVTNLVRVYLSTLMYLWLKIQYDSTYTSVSQSVPRLPSAAPAMWPETHVAGLFFTGKVRYDENSVRMYLGGCHRIYSVRMMQLIHSNPTLTSCQVRHEWRVHWRNSSSSYQWAVQCSPCRGLDILLRRLQCVDRT